MTDIVTKLNNMMLANVSEWELVDTCSEIDIESCFDTVFDPPIDFLEECQKRWEAAQFSFRTTIERKIGNTWYVIETECAGNEPLADKVKRLIFSEKGAICS